MPLKDIGNGYSIVDLKGTLPDPAEQYAKQLSILNTVNQLQRAPYETEKLKADTLLAQQDALNAPLKRQKLEAETSQAGISAVQAGVRAGLSGDYQTATDVWHQFRSPDEDIVQHPDGRLRQNGVVQVVNRKTGQAFDYDILGESKLKEKIALQSDLIKKAADQKFQREQDWTKFVQENGVQLVREGRVANLKEGFEVAKAAANEARGIGGKGGTPGTKYANMSVEQIAGQKQAESIVALSLRAPQESNDPLSRSLRPRKPVEKDQLEKLGGAYKTNGFLLNEVIPAFEQASGVIPQGYATKPINELFAVVGQDSAEYRYLKTLVGQALFDRIKEQSGAGFTLPEYNARRDLYPNESDTLPQAMAKIRALVSLGSRTAIADMHVLESAGYDITDTKRLFLGQADTPEQLAAETATSILNTMPQADRRDPKKLDNFLRGFPKNHQQALRDAATLQGISTPDGLVDQFNAKFILGK